MLHLDWIQPPNDYPTSDGRPMGETDIHRDLMYEVIHCLEHHFADRPDVYVTGNLLWYYREGDRRRHVSPDTMVCFGRPKGRRENYLQWEEGCAPQVVIELTSTTTRHEDLNHKYFLYEDEGVEEYYLFDPRNEYLEPRLRGYHRHGSQFLPVVGRRLYSPRLDLELVVLNDTLRFRCPSTQKVLQTDAERAAQEEKLAKKATRRARTEAQRAEKEARRAEKEAQRAEQETLRAEKEAQRAEREAQRAEREAQRANEAESLLRSQQEEIAQLKALLEREGP